MHVNWNWIRQRPQVLAEALARHHELTLLDFAMYRGKHRAAEADPPFPTHTLLRVPERLNRLGSTVGRFNAAWLARQVRHHVQRLAPDVLWITHPMLEPAVRLWPGLPVIYDCMDDHAAFEAGNAEAIVDAERRLLERADLTLFSSASLARRVTHRSSVRRFEVVNNGLADGLLERLRQTAPGARPLGGGPATLGYFGTVSHWFDWALTARLLDALPQARLLLAGPIETAVPRHPRIQHVGVLAHAALPGFAARCDALLMPFQLIPLIEAVDPVKLYEYIAANRPALAPRYAETERFTPWVQLYRDADEAIRLVREMLEQSAPPTRLDDRLGFLAANTWAGRAAQIEHLLPGLVRQRVPARAPLSGAARTASTVAHNAYLIVVQHGDAASTALQGLLGQLQSRCDFRLVHVRTDFKPGLSLPDPNVALEFSGYQDGLARALAEMGPDLNEPMTLVFTNDTASYSHVRPLALQVLEALLTLPAARGLDRVMAGLAMPAHPAVRQVTQRDLYLSTWAFALRARPSTLRGLRLFDDHETLACFGAEVLPALAPEYLTRMREWLEPIHPLKGWYKADPGAPMDDVTRERKQVAIYLEHRLVARMAQQGFAAIDVGALLKPWPAAAMRLLRLGDRIKVNWLKLRRRLPALVRARLIHRPSRKR